jgi:hypothetical protein
VFSTYREGINYVKEEGCPLIEAPPIGFQVKPDGSVDFKQTVVNPDPFFASFTLLKQANSEVRAIQHFGPDVIVSDTRISPLVAGKILGIPGICILNEFQRARFWKRWDNFSARGNWRKTNTYPERGVKAKRIGDRCLNSS